jgi:enamine deaminase RidA (YjgF/YER057c/UK114 family)
MIVNTLIGMWKDIVAKWCPGHRPICTAIGARALVLPGIRVEIRVVANTGGN